MANSIEHPGYQLTEEELAEWQNRRYLQELKRRGDMPNKSKYTRDGANRLFDHLLRTYDVKNDRALAKLLGVLPPVISKIRSGFAGMGDSIVLAVHEVFEMPIKDIKGMLNGQG